MGIFSVNMRWRNELGHAHRGFDGSPVADFETQRTASGARLRRIIMSGEPVRDRAKELPVVIDRRNT